MVTVGSGRIHLDAEAFGLDVMAKQSFCHWRATDVAKTNDQDAGGDGRVHEGPIRFTNIVMILVTVQYKKRPPQGEASFFIALDSAQ